MVAMFVGYCMLTALVINFTYNYAQIKKDDLCADATTLINSNLEVEGCISAASTIYDYGDEEKGNTTQKR